MKILYVNFAYYPDLIGGAPTYLYQLACQMTKIGHKVIVFCGREGAKDLPRIIQEEIIDGVHVKRLSFHGERVMFRLFPFLQYIRSDVRRSFSQVIAAERPDIVHFHTPWKLGVSMASVPSRLGVPAIATLHEGFWICPQLIFWNRAFQAPCERRSYGQCLSCVADPLSKERLHREKVLLRWLRAIPNLFLSDYYLRKQLNQLELLIAPSVFLARKYMEAGISAEKIVMIRHGIDTHGLRGVSKEETQKVRFGFFGGTVAHKGFQILIEAFGHLPHPEKASLLIWGPTDPEIATAARRFGNCFIHFCGEFKRAEIAKVFSNIDVLVFPSRVPENCPLAILESMAAGVPVLATNLGAIPELVRDGVNGLLFENGNAWSLAKKITDILEKRIVLKDLAGRMGPVKQMEEHAKEIVDIYRKGIERRSKGMRNATP